MATTKPTKADLEKENATLRRLFESLKPQAEEQEKDQQKGQKSQEKAEAPDQFAQSNADMALMSMDRADMRWYHSADRSFGLMIGAVVALFIGLALALGFFHAMPSKVEVSTPAPQTIVVPMSGSANGKLEARVRNLEDGAEALSTLFTTKEGA